MVPGLYPGRTRHIHVKVSRDGIFDEALVMEVSGSRARYDFVLA